MTRIYRPGYYGAVVCAPVGKAIGSKPSHLYLAEELIQMIIEVVESKEVASLVAIDDPFAIRE